MCRRFPPIFLVFLLLILPGLAHAASDKPVATDGTTQEYGFQVGRLIPGAPVGVTEVMGLGGVRYGIRGAPGIFYEAGFMSGAANQVVWQNIQADVRMDIPLQDLLPFVYLGIDVIHYTSSYTPLDRDNNPLVIQGILQHRDIDSTIEGFHLGVGMQAHVTGIVWLRPEMKLNLSPEFILYVGLGVVLRLGGDTASATP